MKREFCLILDWNRVIQSNPILNAWIPLGISISFDADTWMVHVFLLLFIIEFGYVDVDSSKP